MKKKKNQFGDVWRVSLPLLGLMLFLSACGIQMQTNSLYDGMEAAEVVPKPERISLAVEPVLFEDDGANFWTPTDGDCTDGMVVDDVTRTGDRALKISWNRADCEWAGFGIGWDDWAGKDLSAVFDHAAFEMYVRTTEGQMFGLPVVLTLEDYSGNMAWSYISNKYFERYFLDEEWQKVAVPLNTFDLTEDGLDITNIKQLMFELQQAGGVYLDDIRLVYYEAPPTEIWLPEEVEPVAPAYPVTLFSDAFINNNGWGVHKDHCQNFRLTDETASEGSKSIHATWDASKAECYRVQLGASWNKWFRIDIESAKDDMVISLDLKSDADLLQSQNMRIGFEDYQRATTYVTLSSDYLPNGTFNTGAWQTVTIPVSDLPDSANFADIKQFVIQMDKTGDVYIDNIRLVRTNS
ncbi:MAG: glycan-binding surface protein [Bacteroidota bacterium]